MLPVYVLLRKINELKDMHGPVLCSTPSIHLTLPPRRFWSRRVLSFSSSGSLLHHTLALCRTSNDHSTPRGALKLLPPHLSGLPLSPSSLRTGTLDICLSESGRRSRANRPSVSRSYWPVTSSASYYSVQGERKREEMSRGKMRERERECGKHFHRFLALHCLCQIAPQMHVTGFIHQCLFCNRYHII